MEFANHTGCPANFQVGSTGDQEMLGIVACKATWRVEAGKLVPVGEKERWPLFDKPHEIAGVNFDSELDHRKQGTDLVVLGTMRTPRGRPATQLEVGLHCGQMVFRSFVFGDRCWEKSWGKLKATPPQPFIEMPLTNDRAFGGTGLYEGQPLPHAVNPRGRGYHITKEGAEGQPLPNLERPDQLIRNWEDRPVPACWHKPAGPMEVALAGEPETIPYRVAQGLFNQAVPELVAGAGQLGDRVLLTGFSEEGPVGLPMPPLSGPSGRVQVGDLKSLIPSRLATVVLLPDSRAVVATYLCLFRYLIQPREPRSMELIWPEGGHA
jgi:hypothetical protein